MESSHITEKKIIFSSLLYLAFFILTNLKIFLGFWGCVRTTNTYHQFLFSEYSKIPCLFNVDQFQGLLGLFGALLGYFGALLGYFGIEVGSENSFGISSYIKKCFGVYSYTINFWFMINPKFLAFLMLTNFRFIFVFLGLLGAFFGISSCIRKKFIF